MFLRENKISLISLVKTRKTVMHLSMLSPRMEGGGGGGGYYKKLDNSLTMIMVMVMIMIMMIMVKIMITNIYVG